MKHFERVQVRNNGLCQPVYEQRVSRGNLCCQARRFSKHSYWTLGEVGCFTCQIPSPNLFILLMMMVMVKIMKAILLTVMVIRMIMVMMIMIIVTNSNSD